MDASHRKPQRRESNPLRSDEHEMLRIIARQLKKGVAYINTGRVAIGKAWIEDSVRDLNMMITMAGAENGKESPDNE